MVKIEKENKEEESSTDNTGEGDKPGASGLIDNANTAAERLEKALDRQEALQTRQEEFAAKQQLAGRAEAGVPQEKKVEVSPEDYAKDVLAGNFNENEVKG